MGKILVFLQVISLLILAPNDTEQGNYYQYKSILIFEFSLYV
jgi:hypothetical protein